MQCPIDGTELVISERSGVEIDYCPKCRGVWLDRGELDKIIERASAQLSGVQPGAPQFGAVPPINTPVSRRDEYDSDDDYRIPSSRSYEEEYKRKRKRSFLDDIFDFG
jgi:Zn-finger nucleic acid-binding protein